MAHETAPLKDERERRGVTMRDLAQTLGVAHSLIGQWERGVVDPPLSKLRRWAGALGFHVQIVATEQPAAPATSLTPDQQALVRLVMERAAALSD